MMRRRDFITLLGGAAAWPLEARAQQGERARRIGVLMNLAADDSETGARRAAFLQGLQELGWSEGRNLRIDYRWGVGDTRPRDGCADAQLHVRRQLGRWRRVRRWPSRLCTAGRWRHCSRARELDQVTGFDLERSFASAYATPNPLCRLQKC